MMKMTMMTTIITYSVSYSYFIWVVFPKSLPLHLLPLPYATVGDGLGQGNAAYSGDGIGFVANSKSQDPYHRKGPICRSFGDAREYSRFRKRNSSESEVDQEMRRWADANGYTIVAYSEKIEYPNGVGTERILDKDDLQGY
jgi:hypothetical protein